MLNLFFPSEKPSDSDRLNYYADQRCITCHYRLRCVQEDTEPDYTLSSAELEAIRIDHLFQESARTVHQDYVSMAETQIIPVSKIRRLVAAHEAMREHGSIE